MYLRKIESMILGDISTYHQSMRTVALMKLSHSWCIFPSQIKHVTRLIYCGDRIFQSSSSAEYTYTLAIMSHIWTVTSLSFRIQERKSTRDNKNGSIWYALNVIDRFLFLQWIHFGSVGTNWTIHLTQRACSMARAFSIMNLAGKSKVLPPNIYGWQPLSRNPYSL